MGAGGEAVARTLEGLAAALDEGLRPHGFAGSERLPTLEDVRVVALWRRKTWSTSRAVALLDVSAAIESPGAVAKRVKMPLGRAIGYLPIFRVPGLQLVLAGRDVLEDPADLDAALDKINTQTVILQSVFVVDLEAGESTSARTWGQFITGKYQDAIEAGIAGYLGDRGDA